MVVINMTPNRLGPPAPVLAVNPTKRSFANYTNNVSKAQLNAKLAQRRRHYEDKYRSVIRSFEENRQQEYLERKNELEVRLESLRQGTDPEYLQRLEDLSDQRDLDLVSLNLLRNTLIQRFAKGWEEQLESIDKHHSHVKQTTSDKLTQNLESRIRSYKEKAFLDIAGDGSLDLDSIGLGGAAAAAVAVVASSPANVGGGGRRAKLRQRENGKKINYAQGGSASDSSEYPGRTGSEAPRGQVTDEWASLISDVDMSSTDAVAADASSRVSTARNARATKALTSLRPEQITADLEALKYAPYR